MHSKEYTVQVGGHTITAVFSDLADQANGSVILKCEDTIILATAVISKSDRNNPGFFNLTVEYLEKFYASGLILGGQYNKREGRPSDEAILSARIIDRTIRPLFAHHIKNAVQVVATVLSVGRMDPGVLAVNACSLALAVSDIPWAGPVGAVLVSKPKSGGEIALDQYVPNTGESNYELDMTVCGKDGNVVMIESMAYEYDEDTMGKALDMAMPAIAILEKWQKDIVSEIGKIKKDMPAPVLPEEVKTLFAGTVGPKLDTIFGAESKKTLYALEDEWKKVLAEKYPNEEDEKTVELGEDYYNEMVDRLIHEKALKENKRADGRKLDEVRALYAKAGDFSPVLHGTGIFYRGETHVLSVLTLGGPETATTIEGMEIRGTKRFTHHYNFPGYSVGETGRFGGINRREMGHGFLAEKALYPMIPEKMDFPYTIRVVSESTASNGSTSQASICASTIAMMDGGVPMKRPVAGLAMGLILNLANPSEYKILSDIQGPEDHHGDMDFKVAGTRNGITAIQLDIKVGGVPVQALKDAMIQAKAGRLQILDVIEKEIPAPRKDISPSAPKILVMHIRPDQIGGVIGSGGKTIKAIREKTGAELTIEDDGTVYITGKDGAADKALVIVQEMTHEYKVGEVMEGEVVKILEVGAIVKISSTTDGMVHISELAPWRVNKVTDLVKEGMKVPVQVLAVDAERGRISLSIKSAKPDFFPKPEAPKA
ncbi:MAG: polyribonucleotide nucleotidyltransferase [bacterium]